MTAEQIKIEKRVLNDMERAYELTISDINRYKRQAGSITIEVIKRLIRWNYFKNEDAVDIYYYEDDGVNNIIVTIFVTVKYSVTNFDTILLWNLKIG